jgi:acylphosphatase
VSRIAKHVVFKGRVQGVGFRYTAHRSACRFELTGFVRNLGDGSVEMLVQGNPEDIDECLADIRDSFEGNIKDTQSNEVPADPRYTSFVITY